jgi:hypothetical protein
VNTTVQYHLDAKRIEPWPADDNEVLGFWRKSLIAHEDARNTSVSPENRLLRAYDAARLAALAVMREAGYRTRGSESHHFVTFEVARSLASDAELRRALDAMNSLRKVRHEVEYEAEGEIDEAAVEEARQIAERVISLGAEHLRSKRPHLAIPNAS